MNLLKTLASIGSMTFLSRILGFVRDALISENSQKEVAIDKKKRKMRLNISGKFKGWWTPAQVKAECT